MTGFVKFLLSQEAMLNIELLIFPMMQSKDLVSAWKAHVFILP